MLGPERNDEQPERYVCAARFPTERKAGRAYFQAQEAIFTADCDLSAFRLQLNRVYHVAVLGRTPTAEVDQRLRIILAAGEPATLPEDVLKLLEERRARATEQGPWVERHYRPGQTL